MRMNDVFTYHTYWSNDLSLDYHCYMSTKFDKDLKEDLEEEKDLKLSLKKTKIKVKDLKIPVKNIKWLQSEKLLCN